MKKFLLILLCLSFCACNDNKAPVEIYHTGAISGYFYAHTLGEDNKSFGGLPALKNLFLKKQMPFLLFDSGNLLGTTLEGQFTKLTGSLKLLSTLPYTAITLSAEDLKFGINDITSALKDNKIPIVVTNLKTQSGKTPDGIKKYLLIDFEGLKIAVLGVLSKQDFDKLFRTGGLQAEDEIESLRPQIENLKTQGADLIILLSSLGFERQDQSVGDKALLEELQDLDIILGIGNREVHDSSRIIINQVPPNLQKVALLTLNFNKNKQISSYNQEDISLDASFFGEEENLLQEVNSLKQQVAKTQTRHITKIDMYLEGQGQNSDLGLYAAACLKRWGKTNIGLMNLEALGEDLPQGNVTEGNLYQSFPFDDKVMFLKIYGEELFKALENNLNTQHPAALSGIEIFYDNDKKIKKILIDGKPLQKNQLYDIALPDHIIGNLDGYEDFLNMYEFKNTDRTVRDIVTWCLSRKNTGFDNKSAWQQI